jgi:hypothetical protein
MDKSKKFTINRFIPEKYLILQTRMYDIIQGALVISQLKKCCLEKLKLESKGINI